LDMIAELPSSSALLGDNSSRLHPLADAIVSTSILMAQADNIVELDINPFIYYPNEECGLAVDGLIRLEQQ